MEQKTKLNSAKNGVYINRNQVSEELKDYEFLSSLLDVDFNNRSEESQYK